MIFDIFVQDAWLHGDENIEVNDVRGGISESSLKAFAAQSMHPS